MNLRQLAQQAIYATLDNRGIPSVLGKFDGTLGYVDASGTRHRDRCWARVGADGTEMVVRCTAVNQVYDAPVMVALKNGVPTVIETDSNRIGEWDNGQGATVPSHNHGRRGFQPHYVESLTLMPLMVWPSSPLGMTVRVNEGMYWYQGVPVWFGGGTTSTLSGYIPAAGFKHFIIIAIDRSDNSLAIIDGADWGSAIFPPGDLSMSDVAAVVIADKYLPLAAVQFHYGMSVVGLNEIVFDLRGWNGPREWSEYAADGHAGDSLKTATFYYGGVDLKTVADYTVMIPDGRRFYLGEVGLICTELDTLTTQPTIRFGITGSLAKHKAAGVTTTLTAVNKRALFAPLVPEDGETTVTAGITSAAAATSMTGTFYWFGWLI